MADDTKTRAVGLHGAAVLAREKMDIDHVYETLKIGIDTLAAGTGSIQERLWETWTVIQTLNED